MLINSLIIFSLIMLFIIFIGCLFVYQKIKQSRVFKIKKNIVIHDVNSSIATINLILESLEDLVPKNVKKKDALSVSISDLPSLIDILNEAKINISRSLSQWDI